jgi:6-pyruvoyl-tetrahydropterin synthase
VSAVTIKKHLGYVVAGHHLPNHNGLCRYPHGHNYEVEVECTAPVNLTKGDSDEGMVVDFTVVSNAWKHIKPVWDHMDLNVVLTADTFDDATNDGEVTAIRRRQICGYSRLRVPTTAENLAVWLLHAFQIERVPATAVTLWETPTSSVRVTA